MKVSTFLLLLVGFSNFKSNYCQKQECIRGPSSSYSGTRSTTSSGKTCQRWDTNEPHKVKHTPQDGGHHNYCRNPDNDSRGTWCYTTDTAMRWEYCSIPKCTDSADVVRTSYDKNTGESFLRAFSADPELQEYEDKESSVYGKAFEKAEFKALEASKSNIIFTDIKNKYLGVVNKDTGKVMRYMDGTADAIYAVALDAITGILYFTNTKTKKIVATDLQFKTQVPVYLSRFGQPRALAILTKQRKLVFTVQFKRGSKIIMTEMNGRSPKVIVKVSKTKDVTGLAVDDERVYWTDNLGYGSRVMSCRLDGSDMRQHYFEKGATYEDIAVHTDYLYVTDSKVRYNYFDEIRYHIKVISKSSEQVFTYTRPEVPNGIAIADNVQEALEDNVSLKNCQRRCGGLCLQSNAKQYICKCSPGYFVNRRTGACIKSHARLVDVNAIKKSRG